MMSYVRTSMTISSLTKLTYYMQFATIISCNDGKVFVKFVKADYDELMR